MSTIPELKLDADFSIVNWREIERWLTMNDPTFNHTVKAGRIRGMRQRDLFRLLVYQYYTESQRTRDHLIRALNTLPPFVSTGF